MGCGRYEGNQVGGTQECRRCEGNQVGGVQNYPCKDKVEKLKRDIRELEECLIAAATPPRPPRPRPCHCCCCCCHRRNQMNGNESGNQTTWGR